MTRPSPAFVVDAIELPLAAKEVRVATLAALTLDAERRDPFYER